MVTALSEKEHRLKAMEAFADDFLSKPVDSTEVVIRVKSLLRIKAYHDEIANNLKKIAEKNEKLKNLEKIKDGLIHMVVHDLRNPLCSVFGNLDLLLLDKDKIPPDQANLLQKCREACQELKGMIDSLLDIYKIEEGQMQINIETTDLHELINESIQPFHIKAADEKIAISVDHSYRILSAQVDRGLVKRILANLVSNAIRHTPCGGRIKISVGYYQNNGDLLVEVKDTGNGIESAYQEKIFNKFEQVKLRRSGVSAGSSGLGLAFCKLAVEAHGGKIWVESEGEDKGAKFRFTLPAHRTSSSFADD
jgi:signal transduction histidine kinase